MEFESSLSGLLDEARPDATPQSPARDDESLKLLLDAPRSLPSLQGRLNFGSPLRIAAQDAYLLLTSQAKAKLEHGAAMVLLGADKALLLERGQLLR